MRTAIMPDTIRRTLRVSAPWRLSAAMLDPIAGPAKPDIVRTALLDTHHSNVIHIICATDASVHRLESALLGETSETMALPCGCMPDLRSLSPANLDACLKGALVSKEIPEIDVVGPLVRALGGAKVVGGDADTILIVRHRADIECMQVPNGFVLPKE